MNNNAVSEKTTELKECVMYLREQSERFEKAVHELKAKVGEIHYFPEEDQMKASPSPLSTQDSPLITNQIRKWVGVISENNYRLEKILSELQRIV